MKNKSLLITGGAGFIGSHLVEKLIKNNFIYIIDNFSNGNLDNIKFLKKYPKNYKLFKLDINDINKIEKKIIKIDYIVHLAALADIVPSITNPENYFKSNVEGTFKILQFSLRKKVKKIIYSASSSCYGIPKRYPTKENEKINPQYPYALTKYLAEQMIINWSNYYNLNFVSLRFFNVYGPRSRTSGTYGAVFGVFLAQKLAKKSLTIVGNGKQTRDFTYVLDVVDAIIKSMNSKIKNEIFNIGSSNTYSVNYLVSLLSKNKTYIPKRPGEPNCTWADISKAKKILKWEPKFKIEDGVNIMLKNINYWKKAKVWNKKDIEKATSKWFHYLGK